MIAEDRVGQTVDAERRSESLKSLADPLSSMFIASTGVAILAAEKRASNAAMNAVEDLDLRRIHDFAPSLSPHEFAPLKE
jgi:hypothetical protein